MEEEEEEEEEDDGILFVGTRARGTDPDELFFWGDPRDGIKIKRSELFGGPGMCTLPQVKKLNYKKLQEYGRYARPANPTSAVSPLSLSSASNVGVVLISTRLGISYRFGTCARMT
jgi:hypothetical protein